MPIKNFDIFCSIFALLSNFVDACKLIMSSDEAIRATNDDAASCKRFAVKQGYWRDNFIQYFVRSAERKAPEISRGYYTRIQAVKTLLKRFLDRTQRQCQIVNLGAGFDTLYWNLKEEGYAPLNFTEMDFPGVTTKKCYFIKRSKPLLEILTSEDEDIRFNNYDLHASDYHLVAADLRNLHEVDRKLTESNIDKSVPTVFIAECVLVYMDSAHSKNLTEWISQRFLTCFFINYEQVNMMDRFGQVMIENLKTRQCGLPGVEWCKSIEKQQERFTTSGWDGAVCLPMTTVYHLLPQTEIQRIEKLEFLDEAELLQQLFQHYCICWAYKEGSAGLHLADISLAPS